MKDRVAGAPGQYSATVTGAAFKKMQNGEPFTITLKRDDKPEVEGTPYSKAAVLPDALAEKLCPGVADPTPADALSSLARGTEEVKAELGDKETTFALGVSNITEDTNAYLDDTENWIEQDGCSIYVVSLDHQETGVFDGKTITIRTYMYGAMTLMARNFDGADGVTQDFVTNSQADIQQNPESGIFEYQYTFTPPEGIEHDMTHFQISFCENPYMDKPQVFVHKKSVWEEIKNLQSLVERLL